MIAIDFAGQYWKRGVFNAEKNGKPVHPPDCQCLGFLKCEHWAFRPHPKQIRFFESQTPRVLFGGGRGPGKTEGVVWDPIYTAYRVPGCKMIVFRRTMGELKKTIIQRFTDLYPWKLYERCTEDAVTWENGSKLWFGSADDSKAIRKLLSGEYLWMGFDEWSEWPLGMWKFAEGSVRATISRDVFGDPVVAQIKGATNPGGEGGAALAAMFGCDGKGKRHAPGEDPTLYHADEYEFIPALVGDNPAYSADCDAGLAYRKMLASQPRRVQAAWVQGRWDGFEGQYFDCLDESVTTLPHDHFLRLIQRQHWAPRWISIDWGMTHHASVGWHALVDIGGRPFPVTYRTYLVRGIGETALAEEIVRLSEVEQKKIIKIYLSPEVFGDTSYSRAKRMGDVFASRQMPRPTPANNKREDGWRLMHDLLRARYEVQVFPTGEPRTLAGWLITDHKPDGLDEPPAPIECLAQAVCDPRPGHDGDVLKEGDAPHLDVNDQLRYGIASHIRPISQPFEDRLKEELAELPVEGTGRFIKHLELKKKEREQQAGVVYIGKNPKRRR